MSNAMKHAYRSAVATAVIISASVVPTTLSASAAPRAAGNFCAQSAPELKKETRCFTTFRELISYATNGRYPDAPELNELKDPQKDAEHQARINAYNREAMLSRGQTPDEGPKTGGAAISNSLASESYLRASDGDIPVGDVLLFAEYWNSDFMGPGVLTYAGTHGCTASTADVDHSVASLHNLSDEVSSFRNYASCYTKHYSEENWMNYIMKCPAGVPGSTNNYCDDSPSMGVATTNPSWSFNDEAESIRLS